MTNFKCFFCDYNCQTPQLLLKHLQCFHLYKNNIEIFCSLCDIKFHNIVGFKVHIFRHHNENKCDKSSETQPEVEYRCSCCALKVSSTKMIEHLARHLKDNQSVKCFICSYDIQTLSNLRTHYVRKHSMHKPSNNEAEPFDVSMTNSDCETSVIHDESEEMQEEYIYVRFNIGDSVVVNAEKNHVQMLEISDIFISASNDSCILKGIQRDFNYDISNGYYSSEGSVPRSSKVRLKSLVHHKPIKVFHFNNISLISPKSSFSVKY